MKTLLRVLLTGITGFVGKHLAQKLLHEGWDVHAIVRPASDMTRIPDSVRQDVHFHTHSEQCSLVDILRISNPDVVIHLASLFLTMHTYDDIDALIESNISFGTKLLEAMKENGINNFINTGTAWQHYENKDYSPVNLYAASKQAFEAMIRYYEEAAGFHVITLKLTDTYGEDDRRPKLWVTLRRMAESGGRLSMSPGEQKIDIVHVDDAVDAFILAAKYLMEERYDLCGNYVVSSGVALPLKEVVMRYEKLINAKTDIRWGEKPYREREVMEPWNGGWLLPGWSRRHKELM